MNDPHDTLTDRLERITSQSGLLFQEHPGLDGWRTTRPGAYTGEVVAFTNDAVEPGFHRLSLCFFEEGETDEDGYTYQHDTYIVETMDKAIEVPRTERAEEITAYLWEPEQYRTHRDALERIAEIMHDVAERPSAEAAQ